MLFLKVGISAVVMRLNHVLMLIDVKHYVAILRLLLLFGIFLLVIDFGVSVDNSTAK